MNGINISKIGLGSWLLGGDVRENKNNDDEKDIKAIKYALKHGINHIDTSESYSGGKSEVLIGNAIKNFKTRAITAMPQFKLPNFIRDTLDAQVFRKTKKPINPLAGAKSYFTIDDAFKNYMLNGGGYGTILEGTNPSSPQDIFKESKLQKLDRFMSFDEYSNRVKVAQNAIEEGNNWMEAAYQGSSRNREFEWQHLKPLL